MKWSCILPKKIFYFKDGRKFVVLKMILLRKNIKGIFYLLVYVKKVFGHTLLKVKSVSVLAIHIFCNMLYVKVAD